MILVYFLLLFQTAVIDYGIANSFIHNLVALVINPGTYLDRNEAENLQMSAGFEMDRATAAVLTDNTVAGSEKFGIKYKGEPCDQEPTWSGNVVHSSWMGVSLISSVRGCTKITNFEVYKCANYGIYAQVRLTTKVDCVGPY